MYKGLVEELYYTWCFPMQLLELYDSIDGRQLYMLCRL